MRIDIVAPPPVLPDMDMEAEVANNLADFLNGRRVDAAMEAEVAP